MDNGKETVFLLDDDICVLKALTRLLNGEGWITETFTSPESFLRRHDASIPGCLILDLMMPGMSGLEVQQALLRAGCARPIIFLSGRAKISSCVTAMRSGAMDFLTKPVEATALIAAVQNAMLLDAAERKRNLEVQEMRDRVSHLTRRERQVIDGVIAGFLNKQIASQLGIVEKTVKVHRAHACSKLGARSTAELVRLFMSRHLHRAELQG